MSEIRGRVKHVSIIVHHYLRSSWDVPWFNNMAMLDKRSVYEVGPETRIVFSVVFETM
jgi:hypothetical protein